LVFNYLYFDIVQRWSFYVSVRWKGVKRSWCPSLFPIVYLRPMHTNKKSNSPVTVAVWLEK